MDDEPQDGTTSQARGRTRVIYDADYREWVVREISSAGYDRRRGSSLVFISEDVMRRVWTYPANWSELSDQELYAVSLGH